MTNQQSITVLMSTYNGSKYLKEQIESILNQKNVSVRLIIRDDCSTDKTVEILEKYQNSNQNIEIEHNTENIGPCKSFLYLISKYNDDKYFALADQDDIWDEDKLITAIKALQQEDSKNKPLLYYSNLRIVDEKGVFCRISHKVPHIANNRYAALVENLATGCTIVYNKCLADIAYKIKPSDFSMHDAWLYTVAKLYGSVVYDFVPHINYRQHQSNQVGTYKNRIDLRKMLKEYKTIFIGDKKTWSSNARLILEQFNKINTFEDISKIKKVSEYDSSLKSKIAILTDKEYYSDSTYRKIRFIVEVLCNTL